MSYDSICDEIGKNGKGVLCFDQQKFLNQIHVNQNGICRGLCTQWIAAKYTKKKNLEDVVNPKNTTSLLHETHTIEDASSQQTSYINEGDIKSWEALSSSGLNVVNVLKEEEYQSFSAVGDSIASFVLTSSYNYFLLSIFGDLGAHATAFHRPWTLFGKSKNCFFFDPNFGEFELYNENGVKSCLNAVAKAYSYGLSKGYRIRGIR